ncbi:MAG: FxLYD domain-containing protein [Nitrososphaeraceae archaeon]
MRDIRLSPTRKYALLIILTISAILLQFTLPSIVLAQMEETAPSVGVEEEVTPTGSVENSRYLSVTEHRYRNGEFSDQITGIVMNNSTEEVSQVSVIAALYDSSGKLITTEWGGFADVSTLPPGDNSAFSITLLGADEDIDHYKLLPGGTP